MLNERALIFFFDFCLFFISIFVCNCSILHRIFVHSSYRSRGLVLNIFRLKPETTCRNDTSYRHMESGNEKLFWIQQVLDVCMFHQYLNQHAFNILASDHLVHDASVKDEKWSIVSTELYQIETTWIEENDFRLKSCYHNCSNVSQGLGYKIIIYKGYVKKKFLKNAYLDDAGR